MQAPWGVAKQWITLAVSKYDDPVGGVIFPSQGAEEQATGLIFIFPQIERRSELVIDLMNHVLPELTPRLFPHAEGSLWTRRPEYDLPVVAQLKNEIAETEETMRLRLRELEEKIEAQRSANRYLDDLLTATGKDLVAAVARALDVLGFSDVRDADADILASGDTKQLREDLRIMDAPVPVLVEVKGIAGIPKEASALQVAKYLTPRMREWKRYDLHGLAIVNHQRNLPALDRDHEHVFQADVIANAEEQGFGLLTTWDLFRLVRGYVIHRWQHEDVAELFVAKGRVMPIPRHYSFIGVIDGFWPKVSSLGIRLSSGMLRVGDRVAYELPVDFVEEGIVSMQVDNQHIEAANAGDHIAIQTTLTKLQARDNVRVYRVADKAERGGS